MSRPRSSLNKPAEMFYYYVRERECKIIIGVMFLGSVCSILLRSAFILLKQVGVQ